MTSSLSPLKGTWKSGSGGGAGGAENRGGGAVGEDPVRGRRRQARRPGEPRRPRRARDVRRAPGSRCTLRARVEGVKDPPPRRHPPSPPKPPFAEEGSGNRRGAGEGRSGGVRARPRPGPARLRPCSVRAARRRPRASSRRRPGRRPAPAARSRPFPAVGRSWRSWLRRPAGLRQPPPSLAASSAPRRAGGEGRAGSGAQNSQVCEGARPGAQEKQTKCGLQGGLRRGGSCGRRSAQGPVSLVSARPRPGSLS